AGGAWPPARGQCALHAARWGSCDRSRRWLGASQGAARAAARHFAYGTRLGWVGSRGAGAIGMKRRLLVLALFAAPIAAHAQPADWQTIVGRALRFRLEMPAPATETKFG